MRRAGLVGLLLVLAACGDQGLLDGLGDQSRNLVYGSTTVPTTVVTAEGTDTPIGAVGAVGLSWYNDSIAEQNLGDPSFTISHVWARREEGERIVQASRAEIAASLPSLQFPRLLPETATWVTSQLVFDAASATLDVDTSSQFGIWQNQPYTGDEGRIAVLWVGERRGPADDPIRAEEVDGGLSLSWSDAVHRYELFCRAAVPAESCWQMAENMTPLTTMLPPAVN